jgi:hypothetical protein
VVEHLYTIWAMGTIAIFLGWTLVRCWMDGSTFLDAAHPSMLVLSFSWPFTPPLVILFGILAGPVYLLRGLVSLIRTARRDTVRRYRVRQAIA